MADKMDKLIDNLLAYIPLLNLEIMNPKELKDQLPRDYSIILASKYYENQPISVLADKLSISRSHMTAHIDQLVKAGLLKKVPDENDRRFIRVVVTPEGKNVRAECRKAFEEHTKQKLSILTSEELDEFDKSMQTIRNVVSKLIKSHNNE